MRLYRALLLFTLFSLGLTATQALIDCDRTGSLSVLKALLAPTFFLSNAQAATDPDIAIDCDFSDWTDGDGTEFVIDDEDGKDDWKNPSKYDITRFGVASNLIDTFFILFGFDEILPGKTTAAVLIDTDLDDNINIALAVTLINSDSMVELFTCDNSIPNGCGNQTLMKTYAIEDYCIGSDSGPWDTDTFVEVQLPYSDLGSFTGGSIILNSLVSALKEELNRPKDYIHANSDERILYDTDTGEGEPIDNADTPKIGGTVFMDEGTSPTGSGKTVRLFKNGSLAATDMTDNDGRYFMVVPVDAGDNLLVYLDDDSTLHGTSVTVFNGTSLDDLDIYDTHCITRHDNGGILSTANMSTAKGGATDSDILYSVSGGTDLTVTGSDTQLYIPTGHNFTPGGNLTTPHMKNLGTFIGGSGAMEINGTLTLAGGTFTATSGLLSLEGDFIHAGGTFSHNDGTILLDGTGQAISGSTTFYTLGKTVVASDALTYAAGSTQTIVGSLTLQGADGHYLNLRSSSDGTSWNINVAAGATKNISLVDVKDSDASGSDASQKPINPVDSVNSGNTIDWFTALPDIVMVKSVQTFSDPFNGQTFPKAIPGAVMLYTVAATNHGGGTTDADSVFITDLIPAETALFVGDIKGAGSGPIQFVDGAPSSGLSYAFAGLGNMTDDAEFSSDNGSTYTYVPTPDADGFDTNITHMRIHPKGAFSAASGGLIPGFQVRFKMRVK